MANGSLIPAAIAGLAVGIAFVIIFSLEFMPATALTDEELIEKTKSLEEVQLFLELYPDAEVRVDRNDPPGQIHVYYSVERQAREPSTFDSGIVGKELGTTINAYGNARVSALSCLDRISLTMFHVTKDMIANECFDGSGTAGMEHDSSPVVDDAEEGLYLNLTIEGLQDSYKTGEHIIFTVKAEGVSDNACNIDSPSVYIRDDSNGGKIIYWPNPFGVSYAMGCLGPGTVDKTWTYGDDAKSETVLGTPGSYAIVAALEDVKIEKKFLVAE